MPKISISIFCAVLTVLFLSIFEKQDYSVYDSIKSELNGITPDSNIVLIEINDSDIEALGGFPIKRSYYALMFNLLSPAEKKIIAFEIFLSKKQTIQSVYNEILKNEISKNEKVVFPALLFEDSIKNTRALSIPQGFNNGNISFGHINFENCIPVKIKNNITVEEKPVLSFGALAFKEYFQIEEIPELVFINPAINFSKIKSYSFIEFLKKGKNKNWIKENFSKKLIFVGVTSAIAGNNIKIGNKELPGIYLHIAETLNLKEGNNFFVPNNIFWFLFITIFSFFVFYRLQNFKGAIPTFGLLIFILLIILSILPVYVPIISLSLSIISVIFAFALYSSIKIQSKISEFENENISLERLLSLKEQELLKLKENQGNASKSKSAFYEEKIKLLNEELAQLKKIKSDDEEIKPFKNEPKIFNGIVYVSEKMQRVCDIILKASPTDANILILGESGSGKELVAKAIHDLSKRRNKNFVAVNCAALSSSLLESELFGHVKGAFTNAIADKMGRFEIADEGTIFLDEIGETDDNFQAKLLRVIQSGEFSRVGEAKIRKTNARIIAATNKNLVEEVKNKNFREDLYYRLNVITIQVPSLRERKEDIEALANHFLMKESLELNFTKAVIDKLIEYDWKGNVRELESTIKRAAIFAKSENRKSIHLKDLPENLAKISKETKETLIINSLIDKELSHSAINETASELGLSRTVVSETLRGYVFESFVKAGFDSELAFEELNGSIKEKLSKKLSTYLRNIKKDVEKLNLNEFDKVKEKLNSKYRNLPQKYHEYLDQIIKNILKDL